MTRHEVLDRTRQELSKRVDAALARFGYDFGVRATGRGAHTPGVFFFDREAGVEILRILESRFRIEANDIVRRAEEALSHKFDLLGYESVDYGPEIDWHLDAVHGKRAPRVPFYRVRYLDYGRTGDVKVTWELNRHQHLVWFAMAYRLTGDERFTEELRRQWDHWHANNRYPIGVNWASSLEVAFRSLSWIWAYFLLEHSRAMTEAFREQWLAALAVSARHIERYLSTYFSANTHLLGEGVALFFIGTLCPELPSASRWQRRGWNIVLRESRRQIRRDGIHFEQSTYYHVYALDMFLHSMILAQRNGMRIPAQFVRRIIAMLDALAVLGRSGSPPRIGDDDGGRLFDGRRNGTTDLLDPLAIGAELFGREDYKFIVRRPTIEALWLLGPAGVDTWDHLASVPPPAASVALPDSGIYCMARVAAREQLIVDAGPQGALSAGHGHADALSLCLSSSGVDLLIDPGTGEYVDASGRRTAYRGTAAHNTLRIDDRDQADAGGPFSWRSLPHVAAEIWAGGEIFDLFRGSHDGYTRLQNPAVHRRWVFSLKSGFWFVRDVVEGEGRHQLELSWHLGPTIRRHAGSTLLFSVNGQHALAIVPASPHGWRESMRESSCSPVYGATATSLVTTFSAVEALPAEFACMLVTSYDALGTLTAVESTAQNVHAYRYTMTDAELLLVFAPPSRTWTVGSLTCDAEFACLKQSERESSVLVVCNASKASVDGRMIVDFERSVSHYAAVLAGRERV